MMNSEGRGSECRLIMIRSQHFSEGLKKATRSFRVSGLRAGGHHNGKGRYLWVTTRRDWSCSEQGLLFLDREVVDRRSYFMLFSKYVI